MGCGSPGPAPLDHRGHSRGAGRHHRSHRGRCRGSHGHDPATVRQPRGGDRARTAPRAPAGPVGTGRFPVLPHCLAETGGRWQLAWRLGWSFACTRHHILLADRCPACLRKP
ncbi:TniQ family protein [Streptomyces gardneri]|uniref:TniQ family protein n=1 Tax=Streptomyces gardneri TaxID=66892 RepID=UPI0036B23300